MVFTPLFWLGVRPAKLTLLAPTAAGRAANDVTKLLLGSIGFESFCFDATRSDRESDLEAIL